MEPKEALAIAIHKIYCHLNAPMHSAPDHSAEHILYILKESGWELIKVNHAKPLKK